MDQPLTQKTLRKPRILVAPLDWGLGHATRCIPIIRELLEQETEVWLAGEGSQKILLQNEFPQLPFLTLPGYKIRYAKTAAGLLWQIIFQTRKILTTIKKENKWLKQMVKEHDLDAVISDNRYGLYHEKISSVFITHQLTIKSPLGKWTEKILQKKNYRYINRFTECWVPDKEREINLAGELSHPLQKPKIPVKYIGVLSRIEKSLHSLNEEVKDYLLIILSGPEPQRSVFENSIVKQIAHYNGSATIVRGLPGAVSLIPSTNSIHFYNHLSADEMSKEMKKAEFVIARSGYSTIMEIMTMQKKGILIPTPGQTEQEYLGKYLFEKQRAVCISQKDFILNDALSKAETFSWHFFAETENKLKNAVEDFLKSLK